MKPFIRISAVVVLAAALAPAQIVRTWTSPNVVGVPSSGTGGAAGGASNPANLAQLSVAAEDAMVIGHVVVNIGLAHNRVGDITMTLSHCGTSVVMFSGSANQLASVNGTYQFTDYFGPSFDTAVDQASGLLPGGLYKSEQPLSVFIGKNTAGPWVLTIADLASGVSGTAAYLEIIADAGTNDGYQINPPLQIPDGAGGYCLSPVTHVVNVATTGKVGLLNLTLHLFHTYVADLTVTLSHGGVTVTIMATNAPASSANLGGVYTFEDWAPLSFAQGMAGLGDNDTIPAGHYRPLSPLSAFQGLEKSGPWYVTICDQLGSDWGSLTGAFVSIAPGPWDLQLSQPNGPSSVTIANSGGGMGRGYANLMTLVPGAYPYGWLYGIDMSLLELQNQVSFGAPFFGPLDDCGKASTTILGPVPSGLPVYMASLQLDASGSVVAFKPAFAYTTQ